MIALQEQKKRKEMFRLFCVGVTDFLTLCEILIISVTLFKVPYLLMILQIKLKSKLISKILLFMFRSDKIQLKLI